MYQQAAEESNKGPFLSCCNEMRGTLRFAVFPRFFGNFNLELRYSPNLRDAIFSILHGTKIVLQVIQTFSELFTVCDRSNTLLDVTYLFILSKSNITRPILYFNFCVICSKRNIQSGSFGITSSFDTVLRYLAIFCDTYILRYLAIFSVVLWCSEPLANAPLFNPLRYSQVICNADFL